jgi:PAS domain S-box-containing protein
MTGNYRVLAVDDNINQVELVKDYLQLLPGFVVDTAWNEEILWKQLESISYDAMLLDYQMPDTNGLKILSKLSDKGHKFPVIMVTGQGDERVAAQAIQRGAVDYVVKSGNYLEELPAIIEKAVRLSQLQLSVEKSLEQIRYQALLLNNVRDAVIVWNLDGKITYWNPAAERLFGKQASDCMGQSVIERYFAHFVPPVQLNSLEHVDCEIEREYVNNEQETIWVSSRITVLSDPKDKRQIMGYMDVSRDITARKQAEVLLRESEARYRAIVDDHQTEMIRRFLPNGELTFVNETYCHYFNQKREALLGRDYLEFALKDDQGKVRSALSHLTYENPVHVSEYRVVLPNGHIRWNEWTDRAIFDETKHFVEFQSVGRDITDRKKMQKQIETAQMHLIQSARLTAIGELSSGIAHQIYNPLTTIIADAQLLRHDLPSGHPARESLDAIIKAGWKAQEVVQKLLDFSRPTTDTLEHLSVNKTIESALSLVRHQIEANGVNIIVKLDTDLPEVVANSHQLEDLWVNLLLLARDATADGNKHTITITSTKKLDHSSVIVEVIDDGKLILPEQIDSIFEPNFTGPSGGRGSGMELSICREIVRQHGGEIRAESSPALGTVFRVILPKE